ncbi:hypothetical protein [Coleofasciculus sp. H7-2]|uniref:hypothetical protein n=1 Tax=Coleofasciculus sp. H7-2 TaxID=3351545 RepID=UPI00366AD405
MSRIRNWLKTPVFVIFLCAFFLTSVMGFLTIRIEHAYFENYSYFYDPISYSLQNARLHVRVANEGRLALAIQEWLGNGRHPLRTVPLILFAPDLLASNVGHVATALPMLFIFLGLLGWTVHRRTGCTPYAIACMFLFCATPVMFHPRLGLGAYWLDLPAAFLVGGAVLCLLNSSGAQSLKWLVAFATLGSFATLSRYIAAAYVVFICVPVLAVYLIQRWRREGDLVKTILLPLGVICVTAALLAGYFLIAHFNSNIEYYTVYGYALNQDLLSSANFVIHFLVDYLFGLPGALMLFTICGINLVWFRKDITQNWKSLVISVWCASAVILFLVVVLRVGEGGQSTMYALPLLFFAAVSPVAISQQGASGRVLSQLSVILIAIALLVGGRAALDNYQLATHPSPEHRDLKALDVALAQELSKQGNLVVWCTYFDEYIYIPTMETFYRYGKLPSPANDLFTVHESYWLGFYPNLPENKLSERVYADTTKRADIAVVFDDPRQADKNKNTQWQAIPSRKSRLVAKYIADHIRNDPNWKQIFVLESSHYGTLAGYRNLTR